MDTNAWEIRRPLIHQFGTDHEARLLRVAKVYHWGQPGFELKAWETHLLPDGYACPPEEAYEELLNALEGWEEQLRQTADDR